AVTRGQPDSRIGVATSRVERWPPSTNAAAIKATKASAFNKLVMFCAVLPQAIPRHCNTANTIVMAIAIPVALPRREGIKLLANSPATMATAAVLPQLEIQSLQPA